MNSEYLLLTVEKKNIFFFPQNVEKILFFWWRGFQNPLKPPLMKKYPEFLKMFLQKWVCSIFFYVFCKYASITNDLIKIWAMGA